MNNVVDLEEDEILKITNFILEKKKLGKEKEKEGDEVKK